MQVQETQDPTQPWFVWWSFHWDRDLIQKLREMPGCAWNSEKRAWRVPVEVAEMLKRGEVLRG